MKKLFDLWSKALVFFSRGNKYLVIFNAFMLSKIFWETFDNKTWAIGLMVAGVIGLITIATIDYKNVLGREQSVILEKNHEWIRMREQLDRIEERLK